ncbi:hypothetical protein MTO96_014774 [Rhipicephalus appendiculatus]
MSMGKRNEDASTTTREVKRDKPELIDMNGTRSRHTGLGVDYKKACTGREDHQCHIWKNNAIWNGFLVNIGLELQESSSGHICVKEASINEDVFVGNEGVVCDALRGSIGVTAVNLWLSSALLNDDLLSSLNSMEHLTRLSVSTDAQEAFFPKLAHLLWMNPSSTDVLDTVLTPEQRSREIDSRFEDLCWKGILRSVSIVARIQPGLSNIRPQLGRASFAWCPRQLLTTLQVASPGRGPEVDVRAICEAVSGSSVLTQLDIELLILKEQYAAPIQRMLYLTKALKRFGLNYNGVEAHYRVPFQQRYVDSLIPQYSCVRCRTNHMLETPRVKPWIEALLQANSSVNELRFSMFAFCTLECRAFLKALSKNTSLSMVTIPRLGQIPSEYCKFVADAGVVDRVTAAVDCNLTYPGTVRGPQHLQGPLVNVSCASLGRTLCEAAAFRLLAHVHLNLYSVFCLTGETDPAASPFVQFICEARTLVTVDIRIEDSCCSRCWNRLAPPLCDAVLHHTGIQTLAIRLPKKSAMDLLPLADLLHRNPGLSKFVLDPPCPKVLGEFLLEVSKPKLWDNYNLAVVELRCDAPDLLEVMLRIQQVADRNVTLALRAAKFVRGMRSSDNASALEKNGRFLAVSKKRL